MHANACVCTSFVSSLNAILKVYIVTGTSTTLCIKGAANS